MGIASRTLNKNKPERESFGALLHRWIFKEKLNNVFGAILLLTISLGCSVAVSILGIKLAALLIVGVVGVPVIFGCLFNLQFGIAVTIVAAFFVMYIKKFLPMNTPIGLTIDLLTAVMLFGLFIKQIQKRDWSFAKNIISYVILIWIGYNILMFANPNSNSRTAWFYTVRSMAGLIVLFYIATYALNSLKYIERIIKLMIFLSVIVALYGLYQEFVGMPNFEMNWMHSDPRLFHLFFQGGRIRIFSFIPDPSTFGILMSFMGLFCIALASGPFGPFKRALLLIMGFMLLFVMTFAGTRTAVVLIPAGFVFFALLTMKKEILAFTMIIFLFGAPLMMMSTSNKVLHRVQTAFQPGEDESMQYRLRKQGAKQTYIQTHPIGGGLGMTGKNGERFSPGHVLAGLTPDSGFFRVALELGWVGLIIFCTMLYIIFYVGIKNYLSVKNPRIKAYYVAFLVMLYAMVVSHYPQDSIVQLPVSIIFYISVAALIKLKDFDKQSVQAKK